MRYLILVCLIGLGVGLITFGLVTPADRVPSLGSHHPAAIFLNIESSLRTFGSAASELARGLVEEFTNPYRERFRRESPTQFQSR